MLKVVIIDDEYLIRQRIKKCIEWEKVGLVISGEAANGEDAIALVDRIRPHIALVDINMPYMNGLECIKAIKKKNPDIKIIILSGYNRFDYAKEAIQLGVVDYLLKPINKDELIKVINKLKEQLQRKTELENNLKQLKSKVRNSENRERDIYLRSILEDSSHKTVINLEIFKDYYPELEDKGVYIIAIGIDKMSDTEKSDIKIWQFAVRNIVEECFADKKGCYFTYDTTGRIIIITNTGSYSSLKNTSLLINIQETVKKILKFTISIGIGGLYDKINEISNSYREAVWAYNNRIIQGDESILHFNRLKSESNMHFTNLEIRKDTIMKLRTGSIDGFHQLVQETLGSIVEQKMTIDALEFVMSDFIWSIKEYAVENDILLTDVGNTVGDLFNTRELIDGHRTIKEIERWLLTFSSEVMSRKTSIKKNGNASTVETIIDFIKKNYANKNLNLEMISRIVFLNQSYVSNLFKKETGMSIVKYVTEIRMLEAKKLLDHDHYRLDEIADRVGYSDPYYLSKCFKKHYGIPVSKYRNS